MLDIKLEHDPKDTFLIFHRIMPIFTNSYALRLKSYTTQLWILSSQIRMVLGFFFSLSHALKSNSVRVKWK